MVSSLRAKLNAIKTAQPAPKPVRPSGGVMHRISRERLDPAINELSPVGLRRMG